MKPFVLRAGSCPASGGWAIAACASPIARSPWPWHRHVASPSRTSTTASGCAAWRRRSTACAARRWRRRRCRRGARPCRGGGQAWRRRGGALARAGPVPARCGALRTLFAVEPAVLDPLYTDAATTFDAGVVAGDEALERANLIDWTAAGAAKFARLRRLFDESTRSIRRCCASSSCSLPRRQGLRAACPLRGRAGGKHRALSPFLQWITARSFATAHRRPRPPACASA